MVGITLISVKVTDCKVNDYNRKKTSDKHKQSILMQFPGLSEVKY